MAVLNKRRLKAIHEALTSRLAGEIDVQDDTGLKAKDYEAALEWASEQLRRREREE